MFFALAQNLKKRLSFSAKNQKRFSKKTMALNDIPYEYNKPQIKAELTLITKVQLDLFIHLDNIPDKKSISVGNQLGIGLSTDKWTKLWRKVKFQLKKENLI
jgi:hypothetical protein